MAKAATTLYKLAPLLKKLKPEMVSRLVKATMILALTFVLEIYTKRHINRMEIIPKNVCLKVAAKIMTAGWQKTQLQAIYAEASLPAPYPLITKCALLGAARLLDRPGTHPLHSQLPWNRTWASNQKKAKPQLCASLDHKHRTPSNSLPPAG